MTFNLVDEPWVAVLDEGGKTSEVSLREVFHQAEEIRALAGELPTQSFAILRVLLAVLHRACRGPHSFDEWEDIRSDWAGVVEEIDEYLDIWHHRFWMRHPVEPFMQVPDLRTAKDEIFDLSRLICDGPGASTFLSTRLGAGLESLSWAEAARWLIHCQAYDISGIHSGAVGDARVKGGKGYGIGTGWAGQIGGINLVGRNLQETLLSNLIVPATVGLDGVAEDSDADEPVWERPSLTASPEYPGDKQGKKYRQPKGQVDLYTWPSRRIRLFDDEEHSRVTGVLNCQGDRATPQNRHVVEPMTGWRYSEPQTKALGYDTYMPRKHDPTRALWRGLPALLPSVDQHSPGRSGPARTLAPAVLRWIGVVQRRPEGETGGSPLIELQAVGMEYGTQDAVYSDLVAETIKLPAILFTQGYENAARTVMDMIALAEDIARKLGDLARNIAFASGEDTAADHARDVGLEKAYAAFEPVFREWVVTLAADADLREREIAWKTTLNEVGSMVAQRILDDATPVAYVGRQVKTSMMNRYLDAGLAEAWFRSGLRKALPEAYRTDDDGASTEATSVGADEATSREGETHG
jgi:CRISPR system Cascade subunit CasA